MEHLVDQGDSRNWKDQWAELNFWKKEKLPEGLGNLVVSLVILYNVANTDGN